MNILLRNLPKLLISALLLAGQTTHSLAFVQPISSEPYRLATAPGDEFWDDRFSVLGVSGYVRAMAVSGSSVFVGGNFSSVGGVNASSIARWDSELGIWSALGQGISGEVYAIAAAGQYVYAGGLFNAVGGVPSVPGTQSIARWDSQTNTWSAMGSGIPGYVYAIAVDGEDVYAGGLFNAVGGIPSVPGTQSIARWNATTGAWSALGSGIAGYVYAIAVDGEDVYAGGLFNAAGGYPSVPGTQNIARWNNTTKTWSALGSGTTGYVYTIAVDGEDVYAGGLFNAVGGIPSVPGTQGIARWNATTGAWSALDQGIPGYVYAIAVDGGDVYAGGLFNAASSVSNTWNIARWNGNSWSALGSGVSSYVYALALGEDGLYAGGLFNAAGGKASHNFGLWHGNLSNPPNPDNVYWDDRFGGTINNRVVYDIAVNGDDVYVGGSFTDMGDIPYTSGIAKWGSRVGTWSPVGNGASYGGVVRAIEVSGGNVYVGGDYHAVGGFYYLNMWDGTKWSGLYDRFGGVHDPVYDIAILGDDVYVLGIFTDAGSAQFCPGIAKWNISTSVWSCLDGGVGYYADDVAVMSDGTVLVAGASRNPQGISKWDGSTWTDFGNGLACCVNTIAVSGNTVYIGGSFTKQNGSVANYLAKGTGGSWSQVGDDLNGIVYGLAVSGNTVYAVGDFSMAGDVNANHIAKWDGNKWSALGSGLDARAYTLALNNGNLYVGGEFNMAGNKPSYGFAIWHDAPLTPPGGSISGRVTGPDGKPIAGAPVQICPTGGGPCSWKGSTDSQGNYMATGLADGKYKVTAYPPSSSNLLPGTIGPLTIAGGGSLTGQDIHLQAIQPPSPGTIISPIEGETGTIPNIHWKKTLQLVTNGCPGGSASYQILQNGEVIRSGTMVETPPPPGRYQGTIDPLHPHNGYATIHITIQCPDNSTQTSDFSIYIDPSGTVRTIYGAPVENATVTLYSFDETAGTFTAIPENDALMSPANRTNPDLTDAEGHFGWDVVAGFYKVRAEKAGCVAPYAPDQTYVETDVLVIPPAITNLDLRLDCGVGLTYLPLIQR